MKLLIQEPALQLLPSLAAKVGLNEAIVLQQIHFRLRISVNEREGHRWVYKTYEAWQKEEFPFWSVTTVRRTINKLEAAGYLISTAIYNRMHVDKTKWYRINYALIAEFTVQNEQSVGSKESDRAVRIDAPDLANVTKPIPKESKKFKEEYSAVICYLNERANKQFKTSSQATVRLVNGRLRDGYDVEDFKQVIDLKVQEWLGKPRWEKYLRPSTLFSASNFENYLEETRVKERPIIQVPMPVELDFSKGEV